MCWMKKAGSFLPPEGGGQHLCEKDKLLSSFWSEGRIVAARRLRIHGRVQGVCYRDWTERTARSLGLSGWVRNRMDGTVEAVVAGSAEDIRRFIALAHDGPPAARVSHIEEREETESGFDGFQQRATE